MHTAHLYSPSPSDSDCAESSDTVLPFLVNRNILRCQNFNPSVVITSYQLKWLSALKFLILKQKKKFPNWTENKALSKFLFFICFLFPNIWSSLAKWHCFPPLTTSHTPSHTDQDAFIEPTALADVSTNWINWTFLTHFTHVRQFYVGASSEECLTISIIFKLA